MTTKPADAIEAIILRRLYEKRIDGYTLEMAREIATALAAQQDGVREGYTLVPNTALEWLFGEGPAADGKWFGECADAVAAEAKKYPPRRYWWRSKFRQMIRSEQGSRST